MYCATCKKWLFNYDDRNDCVTKQHLVLKPLTLDKYIKRGMDTLKPYLWVPQWELVEIQSVNVDDYTVHCKDIVGKCQLFPEFTILVEVIG